MAPESQRPPRPERQDEQRTKQALLEAAAEVFVHSGVDGPVREISEASGVGLGTIYRYFPTRSDLVVAVYHHQIEECVHAGPALLASEASPIDALRRWLLLVADFLVTKQGLAAALHNDNRVGALHAGFFDRLLPVCAELLVMAELAGEVRHGVDPYHLLRGVANLCIGDEPDDRYDARAMIEVLVDGLGTPAKA